MGDKITNWYEKLPKSFQHKTKDPTFSKHLIKPNSMILSIGPTGCGKTNGCVIEFLSRKNNRFYDIIIFTGSSKDEPLYNFLSSRVEGIKLIDNPDNLPRVEDYREDEDKTQEKLIVFDDSVMEDSKTLKQISKWFMCARKLGFTCLLLAQNYHSIPQFIRRNAHYLQLFKLTDCRDIRNILSHHTLDIDLDKLKNMLKSATEQPMNFLTIALNEPTERKYRHNFTEILNPNDFELDL
jgi:hypothetical protein